MTNVFVHYRKQGSNELINSEMLFSRVPIKGEIVYIERASYEVVRVDHHPDRNSDTRTKNQLEELGFPQDAELWLSNISIDATPI